MSRTTKHAPFPPTATITPEGRRRITLFREPRPEARAAGIRAYDADSPRSDNPHERLTPEWASWDAGWNQRLQEEY